MGESKNRKQQEQAQAEAMARAREDRYRVTFTNLMRAGQFGQQLGLTRWEIVGALESVKLEFLRLTAADVHTDKPPDEEEADGGAAGDADEDKKIYVPGISDV